jgi:hypothetical protein
MMTTTLVALNLSPPRGKKFGVQVFSDHIRPVWIDPEQRKLIDLVYNKPEFSVTATVYDQAYLMRSAIRGTGRKVPGTLDSLVIAEPNAEELKALAQARPSPTLSGILDRISGSKQVRDTDLKELRRWIATQALPSGPAVTPGTNSQMKYEGTMYSAFNRTGQPNPHRTRIVRAEDDSVFARPVSISPRVTSPEARADIANYPKVLEDTTRSLLLRLSAIVATQLYAPGDLACHRPYSPA